MSFAYDDIIQDFIIWKLMYNMGLVGPILRGMINLFLLDVCKHLVGVKLSIYIENSCQSNKKVISKIAKC